MLKDSQSPGPSKYAPFYDALHIFSPTKLFQNMILISVHHICTTAGVPVIRVNGFFSFFLESFTFSNPFLSIVPLQMYQTAYRLTRPEIRPRPRGVKFCSQGVRLSGVRLWRVRLSGCSSQFFFYEEHPPSQIPIRLFFNQFSTNSR